MSRKIKRLVNMDTQIQITGNHEVLVECCKKILEYNDVMVKVRTWDMTIEIWGNNLSVDDFNSKGIYVHGKIQSIDMTENR